MAQVRKAISGFLGLLLVLTGCATVSRKDTASVRLTTELRELKREVTAHSQKWEAYHDAHVNLKKQDELLKSHPLHSSVQRKIKEYEVQALVDPAREGQILDFVLGMSEEERKVLRKRLELIREGERLRNQVQDLFDENDQLNNRYNALFFQVRGRIASGRISEAEFSENTSLLIQIKNELQDIKDLLSSMTMDR